MLAGFQPFLNSTRLDSIRCLFNKSFMFIANGMVYLYILSGAKIQKDFQTFTFSFTNRLNTSHFIRTEPVKDGDLWIISHPFCLHKRKK